MNLENQVTSLELSKRLEKLGVKQESLFVWVESVDTIGYGGELGKTGEWFLRMSHKPEPNKSVIPAYTVAELGGMFPPRTKTVRHKNGGWYCNWEDDVLATAHVEREFYTDTWDEIEVNARAKFLVYLIENKFITL